ncbi:MAG TPA: hypothetical protein VJB60_03435 [Candidatus Peribacterales bacterium]|nr:hypothetical protein [Candidatus Peribacterales bacterium]
MHRLSPLLLSSAIFLTAIAFVTLLARAPFGEIYGTLLGFGDETRTASISLYGMTKPEVTLSVASKDRALSIIFSFKDPSAKEATLTVPGDWHLTEVRGAHASDIAEYATDERLTLIIPMQEQSVEIRFSGTTPFGSVAFAHDAPSPALLTLTHISLPEETTERNVRIVEGSATVEL